MKKLQLFFLLAGFILAVTSLLTLQSSSGGFGGNATGMPGASTCANCHGTLNTGGITVTGFPGTYSPGVTYSITLNIDQSSGTNGFQATIINSSGNSVGNLTSGTGSQIINPGGTQIVVQSSPNTSGSWTFDWTAPSSPSGTLTLYATGVAANGDGIANAPDVVYSANFTSQAAAALSASVNGFNASCHGSCDGTASVTATGGNAPYSFNWSAGNAVPNHPDSVENLCAGTYQVTVYDIQNDSVVESFTIGEPQRITLQESVIHTSCLDDSGSISLNLTGGASPYTVNWTGPDNFIATGTNLNNLRAGDYVATVQDDDGCSITDTVTVMDTTSGLIVDVTRNEPGCTSSTGSITLAPVNGTAPFSYMWGNGESTATISNLSAGTYTVTIVESGRNCSKEMTIALNPADAPEIDTAIVDHVDCHGESTGSISLTVSSNNLPLDYQWSDPAAQGNNPTNLPAGTYTVTITDNDSCSSVHTYEIEQPDSPFSITENITDDAGNCTGEIELTVSGNNTASGFTAEWNTANNDTGVVLTDLCAGTYEVTITDVEGCSIIESYEVLEDSVINFVPEKRFEDEIKMYPNPAVNLIFTEVPTSDVQMRIYDSGGRQVMLHKPQQGKTSTRLNLPAGLYFVEFSNSAEKTIKRLIISQ